VASWKRNLPNEHGGWVLLIVGLVFGVIANPGWYQVIAVLGWLGLFLARVPAGRLLDGKRGAPEWTLGVGGGLVALTAFTALGMVRTASLGWALAAAVPGAILLLLRKRRFMRSIVGELSSMLAIAPVLPSVARAGDHPMTRSVAIALALGMFVYLAGSVLRVRAVARFGRDRATTAEVAAGIGTFPALTIAAWWIGLWPDGVALAALPASLVGIALAAWATKRRVALPIVGICETVAVVPFAVALVAGATG
jgi:hypothetical protein